MKILYMTREYPPHIYGGAGVHVEHLAREMARLAQVEVRCFGDQDIPEGNPAVRGYADDDPMLAANKEPIGGALRALLASLKFNADPIGSDVVHCHTWYSHWGGILARLGYGAPLVITVHSLEPLRPWKREQLGRGYDVSSWIERAALEMADAIIAVSENDRREIVSRFDVKPERVRMIPNGIDTDVYRRVATTGVLDRFGIAPDRPYVLFLGRISRQKGIVHFVRALDHLPADLPAVVCAAAPDSPEIAGEVERGLGEAIARRGNVTWIREMIARPEAVELYSHAGVFCCPSIYEPFGIINLEAMACETPVVASAVGGIKEVVLPGRTGTLVPFEPASADDSEPADPGGFARDLAGAITGLMADEGRRREMGRAGRQRVVGEYSWGSVAGRVMQVYRDVVEQREDS